MVSITSNKTGGGTGLDFNEVLDTVLAGSNISLTSSATDKTLTISVAGNLPAGGAITGANDFSASGALSDAHLLIFSGADFTNRTMSGDATLTTSGKLTLSTNSISGDKIANKGVSLSKVDSTGASSGDVIIASANNTVSNIARHSLISNTLSAGNNISITTESNKVVVSSSTNAEQVRNVVGSYLTGGANVTVTRDQVNNVLTVSADIGDEITKEHVEDWTADILEEGNNISITHNDTENSITISASMNTEDIHHIVQAYLVAGDNVTMTQDNSANSLTVSATHKTDEEVRDVIATFARAGDNISITHNDDSNTLTFSATAGLDAEGVRSTVSLYLREGDNISFTKNAQGNSFTISSNPADGSITAVKLSSDIKVSSLADVSANSFSNGDLLIGSGTSLVKGKLKAGSNITLTDSAGSITISATGGGIGGTVSLNDLTNVSAATIATGTMLVGSGTSMYARSITGAWSISADGTTSLNESSVVASNIAANVISQNKLSSDVKVNSLNDVSATSFADGDFLIASGATLVKGTISAGNNINVTKHSGYVTVSATQKTDEQVRDVVAAFVAGGNNVTVTHDDNNDTLTISATSEGGNGGAANLTGLSDVTIASAASAQILIFDGTTAKNKAVSGDATISTDGTLSIGSGKIDAANLSSDIKVSSIADVASTASGFADGDFLIASGTSLVKGTISAGNNINVTKHSGYVTVSATQKTDEQVRDVVAAFVAGGNNVTVTHDDDNDTLTISATSEGGNGGATNLTGLADVTIASAASAQILIFDGTTAKNKAVSGDATISTDGTLSIGSGKIDAANLSSDIKVSSIADVASTASGFADGDFLIASGTSLVKGTISAGNNINVTKHSGYVTVSATQKTDEQVRDVVAAFVAGGNNVTVTHDDDNDTLTISATSGGGNGGATNLTGLSDVTIASAASAQILIFDGTTAKNKAVSGDATISTDGTLSIGSGKIDAANLSSDIKVSSIADVASTASGFTDGDLLIASGSNLTKGTISAGTAVSVTQESGSITISALQGLTAKTDNFDLANDSFFIEDGSTPKRITIKDTEAFIEPVHTKHVSLTGYTYTTNSLLADSQIKWFSSTKQIYFQVKSIDRNILDAIFTEHFRIRIERNNTGDTGEEVYVEGIVKTATWTNNTYYIIQLENASTSPLLLNGTFANTDNIRFLSKGRHIRYADFIGHVGNLASEVFKVPNTTAINAFVVDKIDNRTVGAHHSHVVMTGFSSQTAANLNSVDKKFRWNSAASAYEFYITDSTYAPLTDYFKQGKFYVMYKADGTVLERGKIGTVAHSEGNRSFTTSDRWTNSTDHHGSLDNITIDFQGELYFEQREERRFDKQKFMLWYGNRNTNINDSATTRMNTTGGNTSCRIWTDNNAEHSSNFSMVPGSHEFLSLRVNSGEAYSCTVNFQAVFYCGLANDVHVTRQTGVEMSMQFRYKDITSNTWSSWNDCKLEDISVNSTVIYDTSNLGADIKDLQADNASGNAKFKSLFRTKDVLARPSGGEQHGDVSPPGGYDFIVGLHPNAVFPVSNKDYQFRLVYASCGGSTITLVYNRQEKLIADRILL